MDFRTNKAVVAFLLVVFSYSFFYGQEPLSSSNAKAQKIYLTAMHMMRTMSISNIDFISAMKKAIKIDKQFIEPYWQIATYNKKNLSLAISILNSAIENNANKKDETLLKLSDIYKSTGKYDKARFCVEQLSNSYPNKNIILEQLSEIMELIKNPVPFDPKNLIYANTSKDEYFPSVTADDNMLSVTVSKFDNYDADEDLYFSRKKGDKWETFVPISDLNSEIYNEGSQTISADGRYMFFVACNRGDGLGSCDIYYSININGHWSKPINPGYPLNSSEWESNPSFSVAGNELFFTSNRLPSVGGRDLWSCRVEILDNAILKFSEPQNLGGTINSTKDEYAPYIHSDNQTLYFLSTGHTNFGGSDIFIVRRKTNNGVWSKPKNLGYPINSESDCYGFTLTGEGKKGYVSLMNKEIEHRGLDIYEFELYPEIRPRTMRYSKGIVLDIETQKPINAIIETFDYNNKKTLSETISDKKTGEFTTFIPDTGQYGLNVRKIGYIFYSAKIINSADSLKIFLHPIKTGNKIVLNNIFFAFNSTQLDPRSEQEMDFLYNFLKQSPNINIEIVGHTDNVGGENFNISLSNNRAMAVMNVLIEKGISQNRLSYKGMGFSSPISSNSTEEGREKNRRVEFIIK